ncbi:tandem-95 repeat protein, partial [Rhodopirellula baltica]
NINIDASVGIDTTGTDFQTDGGDVELSGDVTLGDNLTIDTEDGDDSVAGGNVLINDKVDGNFSLSIDTTTTSMGGGDVHLIQPVGSMAALTSLEIEADFLARVDDVTTTGTIDICADQIITTGSLATTDSEITLIADDMLLSTTSTIDSGAAATHIKTKSDTTVIDLGSAVDNNAGRLELSAAELGTFRTSTVLKIGTIGQVAGDQTASIDVTAPVIFANANVPTVALRTDGTVTTSGTGSIAVTNLAVEATGSVTLDGNNDVDLLAIDVASGDIVFADVDGFTVGTVDGVVGVDTDNGSVALTAGDTGASAGDNDVTVDDDVAATGDVSITLEGDDAKLTVVSGDSVESSTGSVTLTADKMALVGTVSSDTSTGIVTLQPFSGGQAIDLGSSVDTTVDTLELSNAELNQITTSKLIIGRDDTSATGDITVTQAISFAFALAPVVRIVSGGKIEDDNDGTPGSIQANQLALTARNGIGSAGNVLDLVLTDSDGAGANDSVVAAVNSVTGGVYLGSGQTVTVGTVDGVVGIQSTGVAGVGDVLIGTDADGADIIVNNSILTDGDITLNADVNGTASGTDGGAISIVSSAELGGLTGAPGALANSISLIAEDDITVSDLLAVNLVSVTSTVGSVIDDGVETTRLQGASVTLIAAADIGSDTPITLGEVVTGDIERAVDVNLTSPTGTLTINAGGHAQVNEVSAGVPGDGPFILSQVVASVGNGSQLALLNSGGAMLVDTPITITTHDLLLGTVGSGLVTVSNSVTLTDGTLDIGSQSGNVIIGAAISSSDALTIETGTSDVSINAVAESTAAGVDVTSGRNITVGSVGDVLATSAGANITLTADGDVIVSGGGDLDAGADSIAITVGQDGSPGLAEIRGDLVAGGGTTLTGGTGGDIFIVEPSTTTSFAVAGDPNIGDDANDFDALQVDVDAVGATITSPTLTPENGTYTFAGAFQDITYDDIESLDGLPPTEIEDIDATNDDPFAPIDFNGSVNEGTVADDDYTGLQADSDSRNGTDITYSLDDSAGGRFKIVNNNSNTSLDGRVLVADASLIDFEVSGGSYDITIRATDEAGLFTTKTFTIQVVNAAPTAVDDSFDTFENSPISGANVLLANPAPTGTADSDPNGGTLTVTSVGGVTADVGVAVSGSNGGTFRIFANGNLAFDPGSDFDSLAQGATQDTTITYTISDGSGTTTGSETATVTVTVLGLNDTPALIPGSFGVAENAADGTVVGNIGTSIADGLAETIDPDSSTFTYNILAGNGFGTPAFAIDANGEITVANSSAIDADVQNNYTLIVSVTDDFGAAAFGLVFIAVNPTNDAPIVNDDFITTAEDTAVTFNVLGNDSDPEFDSLSVSSVTINSVVITDFSSAITVTDGTTTFGSLSANANGTMTFTPAADYNGPVSFDYTVTDGTTPVNGTVSINVTAVNDAPVAVDDSASGDEDTEITGSVLGNDTDVDNTVPTDLTATVFNGPANGSVTMASNGSFTYTPNENYNGADSFTYQVSDGAGGTDLGVVNITVDPVNDAPVASDLDLATNFDDPIPAQLPGVLELKIVDSYSNPSDPPGDEILVSELGTDVEGSLDSNSFDFGFANPQPPRATVTIGGVPVNPDVLLSDLGITYTKATGILTVNPTSSTVMQGLAAGEIAIVNVKFSVTDDGGLQDVGNIKFKVVGVNEAPTVLTTIPNQAATEDTAFSFAVPAGTFGDIDGDALTLTATGLPGWLSFDGTTFSGTPSNDDVTSTPVTITVTANDGNSGSVFDTFDLTVLNVNDAPVVSGPVDLGTIPEDSAGRTITASELLANASDIDLPAQALSVSSLTLDTAGAGVLLGTGPSWTFVPNPNFNGEVSFSYTVTDSATPIAGVVSTSALLTVSPIADADQIAVGATLAPTSTVGGSFPIGTGISANNFVIATDPVDAPNVEIAQQAIGRFTGEFGYDPADPASFDPANLPTYVVARGEGTAAGLARWNVNTLINANVDGVSGGTLGDLQYRFVVQDQISGVVLSDATLEQALAAGGFDAAAIALTNQQPLLATSENFGWLFAGFDPDAPGTYRLEISASDRATGQTLLRNEIEVLINTAPEAVADTLAATEDTTVTYSAVELLGNDSDADGNPLTINSVSNAVGGAAVLNSDGSVTFTPDTDLSGLGAGSFDYTISDGLPVNGISDPVTATINIAAVDDAAVITGDVTGSGVEDVLAITGDLDATDVEGLTGTTIFSIETGDEPANGTAAINAADGQWSYTPTGDFNGTDSFTVTVTDDEGGTTTQVIDITVTQDDDPGTFGGLTATTSEDSPVSGQVTYTDTADGVPGDTFTLASGPSGGVVVVEADGRFTYTPNANFNGDDTFEVSVVDGDGNSDTATVTVTVNAVDDGTSITGDFAGVVIEDSMTPVAGDLDATDADGLTDGTIFTVTTAATNGTATIDPATGGWSYTPNSNFNGSDSFVVTVTDDADNVTTQTITITVTPVADAGTFGGDLTNTTDEDTAVTGTVTFTDAADGFTTPNFAISGPGASNGSVVINATTGEYTYTPAADFNGSDSFVVSVNDDDGNIETTVVNITVTAVNDAPVVSGSVDLGSIPEDSAGRTITASELLANASDIDLPAQALSVSSLTLDTAGAGVLLGTGPSWTFVPNPNFSGAVTFSYNVTDSVATPVSTSATLAVTPVSDSDNIDTNGEIHPSGLTGGVPGGNLLIGTGIPGDGFVIATDAVDAPGLEIALRADMRFTGPAPAPRDPSNPTRFIVGSGEAGNGPNSNGTSGDFDDDWARWNYTLSINANTDGGGGMIGDLQYSFVIRNLTTGAVLGNATLEQALVGGGASPGDVATINSGSIYQASINFESLFPATFDPTDSATYSIEVTAGDRGTGADLLANRIEVQTNAAPVANDDTLVATEDTTVTFAASEVLGNDTDPDSNTLSIKSVVDGSNGSVVLNGDGSVTFTPAANFNGVADFTYVATDGLPFEGDSDPATVM